MMSLHAMTWLESRVLVDQALVDGGNETRSLWLAQAWSVAAMQLVPPVHGSPMLSNDAYLTSQDTRVYEFLRLCLCFREGKPEEAKSSIFARCILVYWHQHHKHGALVPHMSPK